MIERRTAHPQMAGEMVSLAAITSPCQNGATIAWKLILKQDLV
jgi:hypothetical protein